MRGWTDARVPLMAFICMRMCKHKPINRALRFISLLHYEEVLYRQKQSGGMFVAGLKPNKISTVRLSPKLAEIFFSIVAWSIFFDCGRCRLLKSMLVFYT